MRVSTWANLSPTPSATAAKPKPTCTAGDCHIRPPKSGSGAARSGPIWSMSSLMEVLPDSPSPICSSPRTSSVATTMDFCNGSSISSEFFTPRDQNGSTGMISKLAAPKGEVHGSVPERRELLYFLRSDSDFNYPRENWKQEGNSPTRQSMSTIYESTLTTIDQQDSNPCLGNPRKSQTLHYQELTCEESSSGKGTPAEEEFYTQLARPRPYREFLDEVQTQQNGAEIEAWKKAQQIKLQNKLRRKEAAITSWEMKQKNKARAEMELIEKKMEMKRAKALKKMQQKIVEANKAAEKQRDHQRRSALKKMAKVARLSEKIQSTKCMICLKLQNLC